MIKVHHIIPPEGQVSGLVNAVETITLQGNELAPIAALTGGMGENGPNILIALAMLAAVLLVLRRMSRKARAQKSAGQDPGVSFAASVEIPPYVDTSNLAAVAANIDPDEAVVRLSNTWMGARKKVEANPLYSPNPNECIARDAVEIERIFCSGHLPRYLAKQPAEAFERFAKTAQMLGAGRIADLVIEARSLASKGHSPELQNLPRKGEEWALFRKEIADLETRFRSANSAAGNAGRVVTLADAYTSQIAA
ncbi:hypothetical protein [Boseongicola aestuarii]|jgi:hypothetical protein|uniref:Uncharacterized protein n=1 Tax=Boseongicola aestuarii TaxID=1470561 RepID=A0A238J1Z3_9RHOB|nr:hypothetical protein [Boseongicola aestuarii]SMX24728.1 hypothetical protein BOA8489_02855 [Boseongicola aestuarii]